MRGFQNATACLLATTARQDINDWMNLGGMGNAWDELISYSNIKTRIKSTVHSLFLSTLT
eukprot:scaffold1932_cov78-Skeletonema_dohrnii-CCMP3373.AAC.5